VFFHFVTKQKTKQCVCFTCVYNINCKIEYCHDMPKLCFARACVLISLLNNALQTGLDFLEVDLSRYQDALYSRRRSLFVGEKDVAAPVSWASCVLIFDTRSASPRVNLHIGLHRFTDTVRIQKIQSSPHCSKIVLLPKIRSQDAK